MTRHAFLACLAALAACSGGGDDPKDDTGSGNTEDGHSDDTEPPPDTDDTDDTDVDTDDTDAPTGCNLGPVLVEVGTGEFAYESLNGGDPITVVHGPQGGWHIDTATRVQGTDVVVQIAGSVVIKSSKIQIGGAEQAPFTTALANYDKKSCVGEAWGVRLFLDDHQPTGSLQEFFCDLEGQELTISMEVTDLASLETGRQSIDLIAQHDDVDAYNCKKFP